MHRSYLRNKLHSGGKAWPDLTVQRFAPANSARMLFPVSTHRQLSVLWMDSALFCRQRGRMTWLFQPGGCLTPSCEDELEQEKDVQKCKQRNGKGWHQEPIFQIEG